MNNLASKVQAASCSNPAGCLMFAGGQQQLVERQPPAGGGHQCAAGQGVGARGAPCPLFWLQLEGAPHPACCACGVVLVHAHQTCPPSPLQMLAYDVETVPCFVLLQPDGEAVERWKRLAAAMLLCKLVREIALGSAGQAPPKRAMLAHLAIVPQGGPSARRQRPAAGSRWRRRSRKWWSMRAAWHSSQAKGKQITGEHGLLLVAWASHDGGG